MAEQEVHQNSIFIPHDAARIPRMPISSQFVENISPVTPISGPSGLHFVPPMSSTFALRQEVILDVSDDNNRHRSPPACRSASSTGFTASYQVFGNNDDQYRFEKPQPIKKTRRIWIPRWNLEDLKPPVTDWWLKERLGLLLSLGSLTVIISVMHNYNGKQLSKWPYSIAPNAFLALFTALAQVGLMASVSKNLVQLKGMWITEQKRRQVEFQVSNEAEKHSLGNSTFLWTLKSMNLASVGAVLSVLAIAISPMTQQSLAFPSHSTSVPSNFSALAQKTNAFTSSKPGGDSVGLPDLRMQQAIQSSIFSTTSEPLTAMSPICVSGNCSFPTFCSLAICSKVANVTSSLLVTPVGGNMSMPNGYNAALPNGAYLPAGQTTMTIRTPLAVVNGQGVSIANHSIAFLNEPNIVFTAINNHFIIFQNQVNASGTTSFGAIEVLTYWCVNTYNVSVTNGFTTTIVNATSTKVLSDTAEVVNGTSKKYGEMVMSSAGNESERFVVDGRANQVLAEYMASTFSGFCEESGGKRWSSDAAMALDGVLERSVGPQLVGVQAFASNVAVSMSYAIRNLPSSANNTVVGTTFISLPHIQVSWAWLSLLGIMIMSSLTLMLAIIWKCRRASTQTGPGDGPGVDGEIGLVNRQESMREGRVSTTGVIRVALSREDRGEAADIGGGDQRGNGGDGRAWSSVSTVV